MSLVPAFKRYNEFMHARDNVVAAAMIGSNVEKFSVHVMELVKGGAAESAVQAWTHAGKALVRDNAAAVPDMDLNGRSKVDVFVDNMERGLSAHLNPHKALSVIQSMQESAQSHGAAHFLAARAKVLGGLVENQMQIQGHAARQDESISGSPDFGP